jgi:hypothetical protein
MLQPTVAFADVALVGSARPRISLSIFGATLDEIPQTSSVGDNAGNYVHGVVDAHGKDGDDFIDKHHRAKSR